MLYAWDTRTCTLLPGQSVQVLGALILLVKNQTLIYQDIVTTSYKPKSKPNLNYRDPSSCLGTPLSISYESSLIPKLSTRGGLPGSEFARVYPCLLCRDELSPKNEVKEGTSGGAEVGYESSSWLQRSSLDAVEPCRSRTWCASVGRSSSGELDEMDAGGRTAEASLS